MKEEEKIILLERGEGIRVSKRVLERGEGVGSERERKE